MLDSKKPMRLGETERSMLFRELSESVVSHFRRIDGTGPRPYANPELLHFRRLPSQAQSDILRSLAALNVVASTTFANGLSVWNAKVVSWRMIQNLGLTPLGDVFDKVHSTDVLEIYNCRQQLVYASPNFFELTSYPLEDLYCRPWIDLYYRRDGWITEALFAYAERFVSGVLQETVYPDIPAHDVKEIAAGEKGATIRPRLFSPVLDYSRPAGFLCVNEVIASH